MPILKNAKKALRVSKRKTIINARIKSKLKTLTAAFKKDPSAQALRTAYSAVDVAVKKNIIKQNKAARLKSQLSKLMPSKEMGAKKTKAVVTAKKTAKKASSKAKTTKKTATSTTKKK